MQAALQASSAAQQQQHEQQQAPPEHEQQPWSTWGAPSKAYLEYERRGAHVWHGGAVRSAFAGPAGG
jgi:hypothetical protein